MYRVRGGKFHSHRGLRTQLQLIRACDSNHRPSSPDVRIASGPFRQQEDVNGNGEPRAKRNLAHSAPDAARQVQWRFADRFDLMLVQATLAVARGPVACLVTMVDAMLMNRLPEKLLCFRHLTRRKSPAFSWIRNTVDSLPARKTWPSRGWLSNWLGLTEAPRRRVWPVA